MFKKIHNLIKFYALKGALPLLYHDALNHTEIQFLINLVAGLEKKSSPILIVGANSIQVIQIISAITSGSIQIIDNCEWNNLGFARKHHVSFLRALLQENPNKERVKLILNDTEGFIELYDDAPPLLAIIAKRVGQSDFELLLHQLKEIGTQSVCFINWLNTLEYSTPKEKNFYSLAANTSRIFHFI